MFWHGVRNEPSLNDDALPSDAVLVLKCLRARDVGCYIITDHKDRFELLPRRISLDDVAQDFLAYSTSRQLASQSCLC